MTVDDFIAGEVSVSDSVEDPLSLNKSGKDHKTLSIKPKLGRPSIKARRRLPPNLDQQNVKSNATNPIIIKNSVKNSPKNSKNSKLVLDCSKNGKNISQATKITNFFKLRTDKTSKVSDVVNFDGSNTSKSSEILKMGKVDSLNHQSGITATEKIPENCNLDASISSLQSKNSQSDSFNSNKKSPVIVQRQSRRFSERVKSPSQFSSSQEMEIESGSGNYVEENSKEAKSVVISTDLNEMLPKSNSDENKKSEIVVAEKSESVQIITDVSTEKLKHLESPKTPKISRTPIQYLQIISIVPEVPDKIFASPKNSLIKNKKFDSIPSSQESIEKCNLGTEEKLISEAVSILENNQAKPEIDLITSMLKIKQEPLDPVEYQEYSCPDDNSSNTSTKMRSKSNSIDSAQGSSIADNEEKYHAGQILWGALNLPNFWPCIVYPNADDNVFLVGKCLIIFFKKLK